MTAAVQAMPSRPRLAGTLPDRGRRAIRAWLVLLGLLVYAMILVGGATRLTDSGLSITEWEPIRGTLPPLSDAAWQEAFAKYRETAEYRTQNMGMSLAEFQFIYAWEWGHRLLGRAIGLVAAGGLLVFALKRWLDRRLGFRLLALFALGGLQGVIGWWMVASGLGDTARVDVAPYRLMTHFSLALLILGWIAWTWLDLAPAAAHAPAGRAARRGALVLLALVALQMAAGALVAGLDAGRSYNDWPLMHGEFFPADYWRSGYGLRNPFENRANVQFNHRILAYLLLALSLGLAFAFRRSVMRRSFAALAGLITLQAAWGIYTLVAVAPLGIALIHQALGVIVLLSAVWAGWRANRY